MTKMNRLFNRQILYRILNGTRHSSRKENALENSTPHNSDNAKIISNYRHIYPEYLPDPRVEFRNVLREKLERKDMSARRGQIDIPEFYVGSIIAVVSSDTHAAEKLSKFVGICIHREGCGLRANIILRNVIDQQGVEINYDLYDPTIKKFEVLRLEKRLDQKLFYLRDALPEYSAINVNMEAEVLPEGSPIPINTTKVKLKPRPWLERWERQGLQGIQDLGLPERFYKRAKELEKPWEKYDLMKEYKITIPEEEQMAIFTDVQQQLQKLELSRRKIIRKRTYIKPIKLG